MRTFTATNLAELLTFPATEAPLRIKLAAGLTEFPSDLYRFCQTLEILDLSDNHLLALPDDFARFGRLKRLFLTNNAFSHIPAVLAQCPALVMVSFKGNQLTEFGAAVLPLTLEWLILTDNQLTALPDDFGRYHQLKKLALAGNQLTALPDSMQQCRQLGLVRLSLNRFSHFPDWLFQLPQLAWLALGANPACPVPQKADVQVPLAPEHQFNCIEILGEGASGVIYRAQVQEPVVLQAEHSNEKHHEIVAGTEVALKRFKGWITSDGCPQDELQNYLNAGAHPNLIPILARISNTQLPALAMALIPKDFRSLGFPPSFDTITRDTFAADFQLSAPRVYLLAQQLASVLTQLHERQIMHGDLYAHNVLMNGQDQLYLGDFGAASALDALPLWQQQQSKALEIRAFGYFLADLLAAVPAYPATEIPELQAEQQLYSALQQLCQQCLAAEFAQRPLASELDQQLQQLAATM